MWLWAAAFAAACSSSSAPTPATTTTPTTPPATEPVATPAEPSERDQRLAYLDARLEQLRETSHVPGMAVAVYKDGEVIFNKGFGVTDLDAKTPVTPDTTFMVGSTTKAFTATVMGMLVDEGKMSWDDPISKHVPLKLQTKGEREATFRDALSHRTGFARMSILVFGAVTVDQAYAIAAKGIPGEKLADKFQYNNFMFMASGDATARVAGKPWPALVAERIFAPLGMTSATAILDEAIAAGKMSKGYSWNSDLKRWDLEKPRDIRAAAPAGAITANSTDMIKWAAFQLTDGEVGGKRLISAEQFAEIHKPQMKVSDDIQYGFGWMIHTHNKARYIEHGGNIDGFGANVGFFPDHGIAYVVLTNTTGNAAQSAAGPIVFDALTTDAYKATEGPTEDYSPYLGAYTADFMQFDGKDFKIVEQNGRLAVDVPGQMVFELEPPDAEGRRYFTMTKEIFVTFHMKDGKADVLEMHQGGIKMEIWRKGTEPPADVDMATAGPLLGEYKDDDGTMYTVRVHRGRLAVDVPKQPTYALFPPKDGKYHLRAKPEYYVTFADGTLTFHQDGKTIPSKRIGKAPKPVTLADILKVRKPDKRKKTVAKLGHCVSESTILLENVGLEGKITERWTGAGRWRIDADLSPAAWFTHTSVGASAWMTSNFDDPKQFEGKQLTAQAYEYPLALFDDWRETFDAMNVRGTETFDGKTTARVELRKGDLDPVLAWVDVKTGDVLKARIPSLEGPAQEMTFRKYRSVGGLRIPFEYEFFDPSQGRTVVTRKKVKPRQKEAPDAFPATPPKS